jgi:hypothetical protein
MTMSSTSPRRLQVTAGGSRLPLRPPRLSRGRSVGSHESWEDLPSLVILLTPALLDWFS